MARKTLPLSDLQIKSAKPKEKDYKLMDGFGLCVIVKTSGSKWWRFNYRFDGKEQTISLGTYPEVSLLNARHKREEYRSLVMQGINPSTERKIQKHLETIKLENTFEIVSREWLDNIRNGVSNHYILGLEGYFKNHLNPHIGSKPMDEIERLELLEVIKLIEKKGYSETARRAFNACAGVWKYAVTHGKAKHNITSDIDKKYALAKTVKRNFPVITNPTELKALLNGIDRYHGSLIAKLALQFATLVFVRPSNIRFACWDEFNFKENIWRIPAEKMKMKSPHIVPLSKQALVILEEIKQISGRYKYLFPSPSTNQRPICENTLNQALRRLGYTRDEIVSHSFRGIASTILHENISKHGFHSDVIERQLAHAERNGVKAAYNHAEYLNERKELMQWWADYLDGIKA